MTEQLWNIGIALGIVAIGQVLGTWLAGVARYSLGRTSVDPEIRRLLAGVVQPLVLALAIIAALGRLGFDTGSFVAVVGASTLAIGLALRGSLSNVASGAILLTLRPMREGDSVQVGGKDGTLEALEIYATTLKTPDGTLVTVPNDVVLKGPLINYTRIGIRRAEVEFLIAPDGKRVKPALDALQALAEAHDKVLHDPAPTALVLRQVPGAIVVAVRGHVVASDFGGVRADLYREGLAALAAAKVPLATVSLGA